MGQLLPILFKLSLLNTHQYNSPDEKNERIIRVAFIQIIQTLYMSNQDKQNKSSWEEIQGLSWIFYED